MTLSAKTTAKLALVGALAGTAGVVQACATNSPSGGCTAATSTPGAVAQASADGGAGGAGGEGGAGGAATINNGTRALTAQLQASGGGGGTSGIQDYSCIDYTSWMNILGSYGRNWVTFNKACVDAAKVVRTKAENCHLGDGMARTAIEVLARTREARLTEEQVEDISDYGRLGVVLMKDNCDGAVSKGVEAVATEKRVCAEKGDAEKKRYRPALITGECREVKPAALGAPPASAPTPDPRIATLERDLGAAKAEAAKQAQTVAAFNARAKQYAEWLSAEVKRHSACPTGTRFRTIEANGDEQTTSDIEDSGCYDKDGKKHGYINTYRFSTDPGVKYREMVLGQ